MIQKTTSFKTSDGTLCETVEAAQQIEMSTYLKECDLGVTEIGVLAEALIKAKDKIIDILTMKATSKPRARKVNGGTKKRKVAPVVPETISEAS